MDESPPAPPALASKARIYTRLKGDRRSSRLLILNADDEHSPFATFASATKTIGALWELDQDCRPREAALELVGPNFVSNVTNPKAPTVVDAVYAFKHWSKILKEIMRSETGCTITLVPRLPRRVLAEMDASPNKRNELHGGFLKSLGDDSNFIPESDPEWEATKQALILERDQLQREAQSVTRDDAGNERDSLAFFKLKKLASSLQAEIASLRLENHLTNGHITQLKASTDHKLMRLESVARAQAQELAELKAPDVDEGQTSIERTTAGDAAVAAATL